MYFSCSSGIADTAGICFQEKRWEASCSASDTPHIVVVGLIVVVHVAIVQIHVPCVAGIVGIGSSRPVVVRLHIHLPTSPFLGR